LPGLVRLSDGQDWNGYGVAEFVDGLTEYLVRQESMPVGSEDHEVELLVADGPNQCGWRVAVK
jgi:hypothetical protein